MRIHALNPGAIQGKEEIKFCHLASLFSAYIDCFECVDVNALPELNLHVACESPDAVFKKTYCGSPVGKNVISENIQGVPSDCGLGLGWVGFGLVWVPLPNFIRADSLEPRLEIHIQKGI